MTAGAGLSGLAHAPNCRVIVGVAIRPPLPVPRRHCSEQAVPWFERPVAGHCNRLQSTHDAAAIAIEVTRSRPIDSGIVMGFAGHRAATTPAATARGTCERPLPHTNRLRPRRSSVTISQASPKVTQHPVRRERAPAPRRLGANPGETIGQRLKDGGTGDAPEDFHGLEAPL